LVLAFALIAPSTADVRIGLSAAVAQLNADGSETLKDSSTIKNHSEQANAIIPSGFLELSHSSGFGIGIDLVTGSADLAAGNRERTMVSEGGGEDSGTNKANAEVDGITSVYLIKTFDSGFFVKLGSASADVNTVETLNSGSTYKNASVDGTHYGAGFERVNDNGVFFRTALEHTDFDSLTLTGSQVGGTSGSFNKIKASVDVTTAKFSVGKKF
ncbi:hypothetical protein OAM18_03390, partial [Candidatus Pelagibacter sp.]|nr:hypothetical protein [Candidatus Pelagibacter sp.]